MSGNWKQFVSLVVPVFLVLWALEALLQPNYRERNYEIFTEMVYSKAGETMARSSSLPGQMTQQPVVEGVVVRGQMPFHYGPGPEEAQRAGRELVNPYADEPEILARGGELYARFCSVCHGGDGAGQGPVVLRGMLPPPSMQGARALAITDGEMFHIVTMGQGNMASYAAQVSADDRWKVIRYLRSLQESAK